MAVGTFVLCTRRWCEWDRTRAEQLEQLGYDRYTDTEHAATLPLASIHAGVLGCFSLAPWESRTGASSSWLVRLLTPAYVRPDGGHWWQARVRTGENVSRDFLSSTVRAKLHARVEIASVELRTDSLGRPVVHDRVVVICTLLRLPRSR